jgi:hypothetical protein
MGKTELEELVEAVRMEQPCLMEGMVPQECIVQVQMTKAAVAVAVPAAALMERMEV